MRVIWTLWPIWKSCAKAQNRVLEHSLCCISSNCWAQANTWAHLPIKKLHLGDETEIPGLRVFKNVCVCVCVCTCTCECIWTCTRVYMKSHEKKPTSCSYMRKVAKAWHNMKFTNKKKGCETAERRRKFEGPRHLEAFLSERSQFLLSVGIGFCKDFFSAPASSMYETCIHVAMLVPMCDCM